mmetsp:Transcript_32963/g.49781  ORF Transcript_32963/g.49781 Transcript_32963/m.49781 type:complete len:159 (-) Transcript_32963:1088-1564(-)|eukprot:CAMPEP_0178938780 /NCGR_PEP_ID=MMETSP0786-20121207/26519_1 /TAXON_ID=186022 /ORGANISM="Thalassionema frauenfeldii, Strain CCMP 1798" /LENGTH=158 /DNA_ID=CAMNT_0020617533 /DNA_START=356 /DNA_END=832 /DNA_ORIENTATION=+
MALFESDTAKSLDFPTEPAFLVPVEVLPVPHIDKGHYGVFATAPIAKNTKFLAWTDRVQAIPSNELEAYISDHFSTTEEIQIFLRQGFVLPKGSKGNEDELFYSNTTDAGRFMNHSNGTNCSPDGTLRDVLKGEELTRIIPFMVIQNGIKVSVRNTVF